MTNVSVKRVSLRLLPGEIAALCCLMGLNGLPGSDIVAQEPDDDTQQRLIESGTVTPCGEKLLVDRLAALTLTAAANSSGWFKMESPMGMAMLYASRPMCVLVSDFGGKRALEPVRDMICGRDYFLALCWRLGGNVRWTAFVQGESLSDAQARQALENWNAEQAHEV